MLTLNDGRSELWQWDTKRKLTVDAECSQVHFSNKVFGRSVDVDVVDGTAEIPDVLLQVDKELIAWAFVGTAENGYTKTSKVFKVNKRNKPADYVFTPQEQTSLEKILEKIDHLESIQDPDAIKNAVEDYLEQNPVEAPVQSVNGHTGEVKLTAEDVGAISQDDLQEATNEALAQAKASGEFNGKDGQDYVLTHDDKTEIAEMAADLVEVSDPDSGGNVDQTIETVLSADEVCVGTYRQGILDPANKYNIATKSYVKPFVVSATLISADYQFAVVVYKDGVYVKTEGWLSNGTVYAFDHTKYRYKLYIGQVAGGYVNDFDACRKSVRLNISTDDILKSYNALEIQSDTERRNTKNAVEYMMRRNYDISYANAPAPIGLTTYVGNNQIAHPKVLYFPNKFGGYMYWMAYTPYPFANDVYENPCVAYSNDGYNWANIDGNPLDDPAGDGYNSDTHLVYVESTGTLELWYRYVSNYETTPVSEIIYRQTTKDGINWTEKEIVINNDSGDYVQYLSPAVIHGGEKYKVWVVNSTTNTINYYESGVSTTGETIALDDSMTVGKVTQSGKVDETDTNYMYTEKIKLNATKSFQLTAVNLKGTTVHPALRYVTAYDSDGNVLADHCLQSIAEANADTGRIITMDESVDSVIISIYKAFDYTGKTVTLPAVESDGELTKVRDITLNYQDGENVYKPWHIDVIEDNGKTVLLVMCKCGATWSLFLATSEDNETFTTPELVMVGNPYGWDTRLYRSCIVNVDGEYRIYYSAQDERQKYGLGICTSKTLSNFVGKW